MKLFEFRNFFFDRLEGVYPEEEILALFRVVMEEVPGYKAYEITLRRDEVLSDGTLDELLKITARLKAEEPVQYIFGHATFMGRVFEVDENTLIPRQETEELVAWITEETPDAELNILDIGTGTGCIAISLAAALTRAEVYAIDISSKTLEIAQKNASSNHVDVRFMQRDILKTTSLNDLFKASKDQRFDVIVSNPPYVRDLEKQEIKNNVLKHEPSQALFVSDRDPLIFYRKISELAYQNLSPGGKLFFEINQYLGQETKDLVASFGFSEVVLRKDLSGNDRMIKAIK
ncbi:peptide chain release factor N(5)-glutamine methyltransferase [Robertkochia marina]|uniref:peptide chain release factor N(5)-glutamine methyltransferase n=1 Tax=Robertkochia marina TaxID=1227945 RepID=A0A4S3M203_9FLAO|nr:peptide chain release factor N(5)-glutamine methyltransferase [Robertkochia marina]THD68057.1 peptide chain release factor N(5)-glutamine methyltransferase [Robertkochia marina]TRZ42658.1 peptide chain release factor N(5)-glutamine methyltransferase [Robertkochia marina]